MLRMLVRCGVETTGSAVPPAAAVRPWRISLPDASDVRVFMENRKFERRDRPLILNTAMVGRPHDDGRENPLKMIS